MPSTQILSRLYVGDEIAAIAPEVFSFGCVLNITEEVPKSALLDESDPAVFFRRFPVYDVDGGEEEQEQMLQFFPETCSLIQEHETSPRGPVLVHCAEGKQRSCTVIAAFLIKSLGLTTSQAQAFILDRHPQAFDFGTCVHFGPALERWESVVRQSSAETTLVSTRFEG